MSARRPLPDPHAEIRPVLLRTVAGANYWSRRPVTRLDLAVGAYDDLSSADVDGVGERLHRALPGLVEHRCSVGERGGFLERLRRGTYAPHVVEHVALELQSMMGHDVTFGQSRGGERPGEYTVAFRHRHAAVGLQAATSALDVVRAAFAGTLAPADVERAVAALRAASAGPDVPPPSGEVLCAVSGGARRAAALAALLPQLRRDATVADLAPAALLRDGLPFARSCVAVVTDLRLDDVAPRYRDRERAERLLSVLVDGLAPDGVLVVPTDAHDVVAYARDAGRRVATFDAHGPHAARAAARLAAAAVPAADRASPDTPSLARAS